MYEREEKKQLKPEGSAGAVKQVVPFPLRLKATAELCVNLDSCALPGTMGCRQELMEQLSAKPTQLGSALNSILHELLTVYQLG